LPALASMAPNASVTYTCSLANVTAGFTNVAVATGSPPSGADVTASDSAQVTVTTPTAPVNPSAPLTPPRVGAPAITIVKGPSLQTVSLGGTATFRITVTNTGDVVLHDVTVTDPKSSDCNRDLGTIAAGGSRAYTCTHPNVMQQFVNVATVVGTSPTGRKVTDSDTAPVKAAPFLPPAKPAIRIVKSPDSQKVAVGGTAKFAINVMNAGNVTLHGVTVTDPLSPACSRGLGILQAGKSISYSCSQPSVQKPYTNVAVAVGTSPTGKKVKAQDSARVNSFSTKPAFTG